MGLPGGEATACVCRPAIRPLNGTITEQLVLPSGIQPYFLATDGEALWFTGALSGRAQLSAWAARARRLG